MINGQYSSISAQIALTKRLDTIANNVANMSTTGFRAGLARLESISAQLSQRDVNFPDARHVQISRRQGPATVTSNPLDILIQGDAWFAVETPAGRAYTRDGRFKISPEGQLTALDGSPLLDSAGAPITLTAGEAAPTIGRDGTVTQRGQLKGNIGLFQIDPQAILHRLPSSRVSTVGDTIPVVDFQSNSIVQGSTENSNVNPISEIQELSSVQKLFEMVTASVETIDSTRSEALKNISPTG